MTRIFYPVTQMNSIRDLTPEWLRSRGVKAVLCDLDDTLAPYYKTEPSEPIARWIQQLRENGLQICILTNGKTHRVLPFCQALNVECVSMAMKPLPIGYLRALRKLRIRRREAVAVGDQIFTDIVGGNLAGIHTVLVEPLAYKTSRMERKKRACEKRFRRARPLRSE